jgi:hypothetical protein
VPPAHELRGELHLVNGSAVDVRQGVRFCAVRARLIIIIIIALGTHSSSLDILTSLSIGLGAMTCGTPAALLQSTPPLVLRMVKLTSLKFKRLSRCLAITPVVNDYGLPTPKGFTQLLLFATQ